MVYLAVLEGTGVAKVDDGSFSVCRLEEVESSVVDGATIFSIGSLVVEVAVG